MPNLKIEKDRFLELLGKSYSFQELDALGFEFGIEIEEDNEINKDDNSVKQFLKFDCMNNRPDLLTEESLVRTFRIYLGLMETPQLKLTAPTTQIIVDPSVNQIRPFVAGAILRNVSFTQKSYKSFLNAQQKLHATFCRARKYASMGTHDLDTIKGPFKYIAKPPTQFNFIPLNQEKSVDGLGLMESLQNHKLKQYLHLIRDSPVYPLILDSNGVVCSVPPIINSEHSKISINTKNVFIEVTALNRPKAMICLNTLVWGFSEYCGNKFQVEPVYIVNGEEKFLTPTLANKQFNIQHKNAEKLIGAKLTSEQIIHSLKRAGLKATVKDEHSYSVSVPFWRGDVLHECDILEDVAICYGYPKIIPVLPNSATVGSRVRINKFTDLLRQEMAQAQFNQALNFALCSKADLTTNCNNSDESQLITISNAQTKQFQTGRTTLLPGLLRTIIESKANALPYKLFEAGDCIVLDSSSDTGSKNIRKLAAVITDQVVEGTKKQIFSTLHGSLDIVMKKSTFQFGKDYHLIPSKSQFFFPGQQFQVILKGEKVGVLGVVHPRVLKNFGWGHPTAMWQLEVKPIEKYFSKSFQ